MIDNTKFLLDNRPIIERLYCHPDFIVCKPQNNRYFSLSHKRYGVKLRLDFRTIMLKGAVIGYRHVEINISPHYHKNNYQHNGDDFTPLQAIKSIKDVLCYLNIKESEYSYLKVVNLEFGVNIILHDDIKNIMNGLYYHNKDQFIIPDERYIYSKRSDTTKYKQIKVYAKGIQFATNPGYRIDPNTLRFEVKSKESKYIRTQKIYTALDLLNVFKYEKFADTLLLEWERVLVINLISKTRKEHNSEYWSNLITNEKRNIFRDNKIKYYDGLIRHDNIHLQVKLKLIDKIYQLLNNAISTQKTTINPGFLINDTTSTKEINVENAYLHRCIITGIDISSQKKGSKFLRETTLRDIKINDSDLFQELSSRYLTDHGKQQSDERKIYLICKNIRDVDSNKRNCRKSFEKRNYNANQLQFCFRT
ncbi:hypothetical protein [Chryseobacterium carnipullorum]|nr:hypothetical protein [Chryseobacterium carnipullorum]STC92182.1 Uncharacterised protein [Chryseobacterium carnipullorum]